MGILSLEHVSYQYKNRYQTVDAVKDADYSFERGQVYAIVGKSGSGKTTMLSLMAGLDVPTGGQVLFEGTPTSKMDRDMYRRKDVTVIYQNFNLFPLLTVLENVMYPLQLEGISKAAAAGRAQEMIQVVGLTQEVYRRYPAMLSGGERQRIAIARALATDAKVILADEPTGNLDVGNGNNVIELLFRLAHDKEYCVIIVTHDNSIAERADVVLQVKDGQLIKE